MSITRIPYEIQELSISTDRINVSDNDNFSVDIKNLALEINIYEDIERPYLTGSILVGDSFGIRSGMRITGTERVKLRLRPSNGSPSIEKNFIITGIQKSVKTNDRNDVYLLTMIEDHAYLDAVKTISKSYTSSLEYMIQNIARGELDKELDTSRAARSSQSNTRYIVPYQSPLDAMETIRDRMATVNGSPYFLFSTLRDDKIHLADLEHLFQQSAWNSTFPYAYGENVTNLVNTPSSTDRQAREIGELFTIYQVSSTAIESSLKLIKAGAMGANFSTVDITSGERYRRPHSGRDTALNLVESIHDPRVTVAVDNSLRIGNQREGEKPIDQYQSVEFTQIAASRIFDYGINDYHSENQDAGRYILKLKAAALKEILTNSVYTWTVPGAPYINGTLAAGVGTSVEAVFPYASTASNRANEIDRDRSGKYLIYKAKHTFTLINDQYNVHMDVVKLTKRN